VIYLPNRYTKDSVRKGDLENDNLDNVKKDLDNIHKYHSVFEELDNPTKPQASMHIENDVFMKNQLLISKIKDKQEITHRLSGLAYNVAWLRSAILVQDEAIINKAINNVLKSKYSSISAITQELNSLRNRIDEFENSHTSLLKGGFSLDAKTLLEQDFRKNHKNLNELYDKQKSVFLNLSDIFVKLAKHSKNK
jgi:hypothetical protein